MNSREVEADSQKLKDALVKLPEPVVNPAFVIVSGLPGVGKSYFSRKLAERIPGVIIESDAMRKQLFPNPKYRARESKRLFDACHWLIEDLLRSGITVILDATNLIEQHREKLYRIANRSGAKLAVVQVEASPEVVLERLQGRERGIEPCDNSDAVWDVHQRMKMKAERIRHNYFAVDTSKDIEQVINKIVRVVKR
jgi:predicted kinase